MGWQSEASGNVDLRKGESRKYKQASGVPGRGCPSMATDPLEGLGLLTWWSPGQVCQVTGSALAAPSRQHRMGETENLLLPLHLWAAFSESYAELATHVPFLKVWEEGPHGLHLPICYSHTSVILSQTLPLLAQLGLLWFTLKDISSSLGVSAEQCMAGGHSLWRKLLSSTEVEELKCCIKLLESIHQFTLDVVKLLT